VLLLILLRGAHLLHTTIHAAF